MSLLQFHDVKSARVLTIYSRLVNGDILRKEDLANEFHVTVRSIQRDIESLRCFFSEQRLAQDILYDHHAKGYRLTNTIPQNLSNNEILAVCKILLESRSMSREEMMPILDKLIACCVPAENRKAVNSLVSNERYHYIEPHHGRPILTGLWEIGKAIQGRNIMDISYQKMGSDTLVTRTIEPVGLLFSEYYFYLAAFIRNIDRQAEFEIPDDLFPTIYRIDRIRSFQVLDEHFQVPYGDRFEEGEFRKRIQFMYGGRLQQIRFKYTGPSVEAVLDRLPTAQVVSHDAEGWTISAEAFGKGVNIWVQGQGDYIKELEIKDGVKR